MTTGATVPSRDGNRIAYEVSGVGSPTVAFVHGWSCDQTYWADQVSEFAETHRVITLDLVGHGRSSKARTTWSVGEFARDVVAVLEAVDASEVIVVGHSLGGPVAVEAALLAPDRAVAVVGVECFFDVWRDPAFTAVLEAIRGDFVGQTRAWVSSAMFAPHAPPALVERVASAMAAAPPEIAIPAFAGLLDWASGRLVPALGALAVPLRLIMAGDPPYPTTLAEQTIGPERGFGVDAVPGVGHFLMCEAPGVFNDRLRGVIEQLRT